MKVIVCRAGRIADELLKRIGPNWRIIVIEKIKTVCEKTAADIRDALSRWSESLEIEVLDGEGDVKKKFSAGWMRQSK